MLEASGMHPVSLAIITTRDKQLLKRQDPTAEEFDINCSSYHSARGVHSELK